MPASSELRGASPARALAALAARLLCSARLLAAFAAAAAAGAGSAGAAGAANAGAPARLRGEFDTGVSVGCTLAPGPLPDVSAAGFPPASETLPIKALTADLAAASAAFAVEGSAADSWDALEGVGRRNTFSSSTVTGLGPAWLFASAGLYSHCHSPMLRVTRKRMAITESRAGARRLLGASFLAAGRGLGRPVSAGAAASCS